MCSGNKGIDISLWGNKLPKGLLGTEFQESDDIESLGLEGYVICNKVCKIFAFVCCNSQKEIIGYSSFKTLILSLIYFRIFKMMID